MSKEYYEKYIENIHLGLLKSQFFIDNKIEKNNFITRFGEMNDPKNAFPEFRTSNIMFSM